MGFLRVNDWYKTHYIEPRSPLVFELRNPLPVKAKEEPKVIEKTITPATLEEVDTPIKKYACDKWLKETGTDAYCLTMIAVFQAESGWDQKKHPMNDNGTLDWGIAQINESNWDIPGCEIFTIVLEGGNIDCGYIMWDRGDGKEGNGKGKAAETGETGVFLP